MKNYEVIIGLEIHVELSTKTKIFCACKNEFGAQPNTNVCPVCLSMPGTLPVINKKVVEYGVKAGYALNCNIPNFSKMDRKNYTYPDLAKSYQISQYDFPLCKEGYVDLDMDGYTRRVGITRIHIEEDAGKLVHKGDKSFVDYNRGGVPLIEIVTQPDIRTAEEVRAFLETVKANMEYIGVSDCKMQEGSMRCDINISVRKQGETGFNTRTELKNLNSISTAVKAVNYEAQRHISVMQEGKEIVQETRRWDDDAAATVTMRGKEEAHDYRYFPDPDLVPIYLSDDRLLEIKNGLPELPKEKKQRYIKEYALSEYDAGVLTSSKYIAEFFEDCVAKCNEPKAICNYIMVDLLALLKEYGKEPAQNPMKAEFVCETVELIKNNVVNSSVAKQVFRESFETGRSPKEIVEEKGLKQIDDKDDLLAMIKQIISDNPKPVEDYRSGNKKALTFFVGQVMKQTKGKANPKTVNELLTEELK